MIKNGDRSSIQTRPRQLRLPSSGMSSDVQSALMRLEASLKAIPPRVREERERSFQQLQEALGRGKH